VQIEDFIPLALRLAFVAVLYFFLARVVAAIWTDIRRGSVPRSPAAPRSPVLEVVQPGASSYRPGQIIVIDSEMTFGREPDNHVVLTDDSVSARHARIARKGGAWLLQDLGSTNGTRVNRRELSGTVKLKSGDVIDLGRVTLRFEVEARRTSEAKGR
jgi:hypothetical protein